ncbi:MAG: flagellar filament capping protein FliD [Pseudomonadota bacterium]
MASIQSLGVGSGLLTSELVETILTAERAPMEKRLNLKQAVAEAKISAFGELKTSLSSFDAALSSLALPSTFNANQVKSSNDTAIGGTASTAAVAGTYAVAVSQLAQSHSIASSSYTAVTSVVGTGTLTFRFGTTTFDNDDAYESFALNTAAQSRSIVINSTNNTLSGIRDAVNNANFGVQASIVDDGSGYRLVFRSKESGEKNSLEVVATGTTGLKALNYSLASQSASLNAVTATGSTDLATGGGLDTANKTFSLSYMGTVMDITVASNPAINTTGEALTAIQAALDAQLVLNGYAAGDVLAVGDNDNLSFETLDTGFATTLEVLSAGSAATVTGSTVLSDGFDFSANNATFSIAVDGGPAQAITLNTVSASRAATVDLINQALVTAGLDSDVEASLDENDALVFTRLSTGSSGSIAITDVDVSGTAASAELGLTATTVTGLDGFGLNTAEGEVTGSSRMEQTIEALDAEFTVNGLAVTRASNSVTGVISGTTLTLKTVTAAPVTVSVTKDSTAISDKLQSFADSYNELKGISDALTAFNPNAGANGQGSLLIGDSTLRMVMAEINSVLRSAVSGLTGNVRSLSEIGISTNQNNGYLLEFDAEKFADKFATNSSDILALFATAGTTTDSDLSYASSNALTQSGTYDIEITRMATTGSYNGHEVATLGAGNIVIDDDNDGFTLKLNGTSAAVTLAHGTYATADALAEQIQIAINSAATLTTAKHSVAVTFDADEDRFVLSSNMYGANSTIAFTATDAAVADTLGFTKSTQGPFATNSLGGLATPTGLSSENFSTAVTLNADTSFKLEINGVSSDLITIPGSSGSPQIYTSPDALMAAINAQLLADPLFQADAASTAAGDVLTAGYDFSADNRAFSVSLDGGDTSVAVLVDGDASLVSFGGETPGTIENTLAAVQAAIDATALNGLVEARLDDSDQLYFATVATGSAAQIMLTADDFAIGDANTTGDDAEVISISYSYDADLQFGKFTFASASIADEIEFTDVSSNAGSKLGLFNGLNPVATATAGVDVEGTINGIEATGSGQYLRANSGNVPARPGFYLNTTYGNLAASTPSDTFKVTVDGVESDSISLGVLGNLNPTVVAAGMQTAINNSPALLGAGVGVVVEYDPVSGGFGIISTSTGVSSSVRITDLGGSAGSILGFSLGMGAQGAIGVNASGEPDPSSGIRLLVSGGDIGSRGSVSYIKGVADRLTTLLDGYLGTEGVFTARTDALNLELEDIAEKRVKLDERIERSEQRLRSSFLANDKIINMLNTTADFLTSQLTLLEDLASATMGKK